MFARSVSLISSCLSDREADANKDVGGQMGYSGYCKLCESYAAKLLIQELGSMNVKVTIGLEDEFPRDS
jgi:hypothetical protein